MILVLTVGAMFARLKARPDSNLPFFYYFFLFAYHINFGGVLNPTSVYVAVVCGLFLRFEFMSRFPRVIFIAGELVALVVVLSHLWGAI